MSWNAAIVRRGRLAAFVLSLAATGVATADVAAQAPPSGFMPREERPEDLPAGPGREETFYACTACHNFKLVAAQGMSRAQWDESMTWMTRRHNMADIQGADRKLILDYLAKHYPPRAPAPGGWRNPFAPQ